MRIRSKIHFCDFMTSSDPIEIVFADHRPSYLTVLPRPVDWTNVSSSFVSAYIQLTIKHFPFFFFRSLLSHNFIASKRSAWISILFARSDIHKLFFFPFLSSINRVSPIFGIIIVNWVESFGYVEKFVLFLFAELLVTRYWPSRTSYS